LPVRSEGSRIENCFGTDALARMHECNAEEFIQHVRDGRVDPKAVVISAKSLAAESLSMADQIGSIAPGLQAESCT
jgi:imidazolonepropionase-like amidohydrolase